MPALDAIRDSQAFVRSALPLSILAASAAISANVFRIVDAVDSGDAGILADAWIMTAQFAVHVPFFLVLAAIVRPRIGPAAWATSILLAHASNELHLFHGVLHGLLQSGGLYPAFIAKGPGGQANVQWGLVIPHGIAAAVLCWLCIRRTSRTFSRVFVLLVVLVTTTTTALFHVVVVEAGVSRALADARAARLALIEAVVATRDEADFRRLCRAVSAACETRPLGERPAYVPYRMAVVFDAMLDAARQAPLDAIVWRRHAAPASPLESRVAGGQAVFVSAAGRYRVAFDEADLTPVVARAKVQFAVLVSAAHAAWVLLGGALMLWHSGRLGRRADRAVGAVSGD